MNVKVLLSGLAVVCAGTLLAVPEYVNDFTTRASAPAPSGEWMELPYVVGTLAADYDSTAPTTLLPFNGTNFQDSWFKATVEKNNVPSTFAVSVNSSDGSSPSGDSNQYFRYGHSADVSKVVAAATPFYNSFSTGVLRFQVDIRAPGTWPSGNGFVRIQPINGAMLASPNWTTAPLSFMHLGLQKQSNSTSETQTLIPVAMSGNGSGGGASLNNPSGKSYTTDHWYRFVIDMDLSNSKFSGTFYDQGEDHPELTDANGTKICDYQNKTALYTIEKSGAIEGFAIRLSNIKTSNPTLNKRCPCVDNIICSWKAPGEADFVKFYENDFMTRRYRRVSPTGTAAHIYTSGTAVSSTSYMPYANITASTTTNLVKQILPAYVATNTIRQAEGAGNWRRANSGAAAVGVVTYASGNPSLRFSHDPGTNFAISSQTLGEEVSSGKVCLSCDIRTPDKWYWSSYTGAYAMLGTDNLWGAHNSKITAASLTRYGIQAPANKTTQFNVTIVNADSSKIDEDVSLKPNTWYRVVQVADLETWKMSGTIYEIGASPIGIDATVDETNKVHEIAEAPMRGTKTSIASFALCGYGAGASTKDATPHLRHIYFDNVKVWKNWNAETAQGDLIYKDDFRTMTRYYAAQTRGQLIGTYNMDNGQDHWIRRNNGAGSAWIMSGENPCVAAGDPASHTYAVQDLGASYTDRVVVQGDIRPPASWLNSGARAAQIAVGGDKYLNGNRGTGGVTANKAFSSYVYGAFGFGNDGAQNGVGFWEGSKLRFSTLDEKGADIYVYPKTLTKDELSHWFRFKATFNLKAGMYDVKVYDQGAHPTSAAAPNGTLYYAATGLKMRAPAEPRGVTSICLNTYGNQYVAPYDPEDPGLALYDNLKIVTPKGLTIILR